VDKPGAVDPEVQRAEEMLRDAGLQDGVLAADDRAHNTPQDDAVAPAPEAPIAPVASAAPAGPKGWTFWPKSGGNSRSPF